MKEPGAARLAEDAGGPSRERRLLPRLRERHHDAAARARRPSNRRQCRPKNDRHPGGASGQKVPGRASQAETAAVVRPRNRAHRPARKPERPRGRNRAPHPVRLRRGTWQSIALRGAMEQSGRVRQQPRTSRVSSRLTPRQRSSPAGRDPRRGARWRGPPSHRARPCAASARGGMPDSASAARPITTSADYFSSSRRR